MILLTQAQRQQFTRFPRLDERLLAQHYLLNEEDLKQVKGRRRDFNRLGYAVQLTVLKHLGRGLAASEQPPHEILVFLSEQLGVEATSYPQYAQRANTRHEHFAELCRRLGYAELNRTLNQELRDWLLPHAVITEQPFALMTALMDELRRRRILIPRIQVLERLVAAVRVRADQHTYSLLDFALANRKERADALLTPLEGQAVSRYAWLKQPVGAPKTKNITLLLDKLSFVRTFPVDSNIRSFLPRSRLAHLAEEGRRLSAHNLRDFTPVRRRATVMALLLDLSETLTDAVLEMHDRLMLTLLRGSQRESLTVFQQRGPTLLERLTTYQQVCEALLTARETASDPFQAVEAVVSWQKLTETVRDGGSVTEARQLDPLHHLLRSYPKLRAYLPKMLQAFEFTAAPPAQPLVNALKLLKDLYRSGRRALPPEVPLSFVRPRWTPFVLQQGQVNRKYYEFCVMEELRLALRAGDVWVTGSRKYRDLEAYLLPVQDWQGRKATLGLLLPETFEVFWESTGSKLNAQLAQLSDLLNGGQLVDVRLQNGKLKIKALQKSVPEGTDVLVRQLSSRLPRVRITDLLLEVQGWLPFTAALTDLRSGKTSERPDHLLTALLAEGLNLGLTKMAEASSDPAITPRRLMYLSDWFLRPETYAAALAEVVNFQSKQPLAALWGDGSTSSSDGQRFPTGGRGKTYGHLNAKYGREPGVLFYTHLSDQYAPFHTKVITANIRDAVHVLDGLLYHQSALQIKEHYTDTAGYTEQVFGLCFLLGFRFAPRIRDLGDTRLYPPDSPSNHALLEPIMARRLNLGLIEAHWNELLRLAVSIQAGTVTASLILSKLASYPRQNSLALALRELGRVQRTLFTLEWLQDPALRRRVQAGLNKGEAHHALARAVAFHRSGEIRDRSPEAQSNRASGVNLLVGVITAWNTVYLERAVTALRAEGHKVPDELLAHVSPLGWEHIGLTGDYQWRPDEVPEPGTYRKLTV
ncbi:TnpA family transposase [Deinococcus sp. HSC-46F16]|uniref:Tn3 family transposase n=1 Tax=Deinococcus sp. HSC-46F16 TaxID=2910968 RepID=UPI00209D7D07|nr:Tn3 family transposase [Deinococcus sp. HSC-46F16]MCP2014015.1 TnpA family transposase [Deinococcus sp. HSC-46F16]